MDKTLQIAIYPKQRVASVLTELFDRAFFWRVGLAVAAILLCLQFEWHTLRFLTSEIPLRVSTALGLSIQRIAFDKLKFRGSIIGFTINCTWIAGLFGIFPLLRMSGCRYAKLRRMAIFVTGFFLLNLVRIELVILLYRPGVSWNLEHGWITGISEFLVYLWVINMIDHPLARFLRSGKLPRAVVLR